MANYSDVSICNMALAILGADSIRDFDESNKRARLCQVNYYPAKDYLLTKFDWPFARAFKQLKELDLPDDEVPPNMHAFKLPSDCKKPVAIHPLGSKTKWEVFGDALYSPNASIGLYYTTNNTSPAKFSDTFAHILSLMLAYKLCPPITQDVDLTQTLYEQFKVDIMDAMEPDANMGNYYREPNEDPNFDTFVYPDGYLDSDENRRAALNAYS